MTLVAESRDALKCQLVADVLRSFGEVRLRVKGGSMLPALWPGDVLTISRCGDAQVLPGDIVAFPREGFLVTHRVVQTIAGPGGIHCITRGDRLRHNDPPVSNNELLGRVTAIHRGQIRIDPRAPHTGRHRIALLALRSHQFARAVVSLRALWRKASVGLPLSRATEANPCQLA